MWPLAVLSALVLLDVPLKTDTTSVSLVVRGVRLQSDLGRSVRLQPDREVLTHIQIQGNVATSDEEVRQLAAVEIGMAVGPETAEEVAGRLRATNRFERVEVLTRFASIADPTKIVLVIIVDEGPVRIEMTGDPNQPTRVVRRRRPNVLFLPVLDAEDGYGLTYGVRLAMPGVAGPRSRVSFPLTWGGEKRAGAELDKAFDAGPIGRLLAGGSISSTTHPFFDEDLDRERVWLRAERTLTPSIRVAAAAGWQHVSFMGARDSFAHAGADIVVDTRLDPMLTRNALYARAAWDRFALAGGVNRLVLDARGYVGLIGQPILVLRALRDDSDRPLPPYLRQLLGGTANLRGFEAGSAIGDTLLAGSAEVLVPLTSPLRFGKMGVSAFADVGVVYDKGERLSNRPWRRGYGGGVWFAAAFVRISVAVAHGVGASTRAHIGGGVSF